MQQSKLPLIIIVAPESWIVNTQIGVQVSKFWLFLALYLQRNGHFQQYNGA